MRYFYKVAPTKVIRADENYFTYHSEQQLKTGTLVRVSVGKSLSNGVVIGIETKTPQFKTKPIDFIISATALPKQLIGLAEWLSSYYATHLATVLQAILPSGLQKIRRQKQKDIKQPTRKRTNILLNEEQSSALRQILSDRQTFLLHGVTGSGKTIVYIQAAKHMQQLGRSSIILVPEISLTPQLVAEFANYFDNLLVTHSALTEAQRHNAWQKALESKEPLVIIGPRSALFMPVTNLGLIVVDECHEPSYKQDQSPRYLALRAASVLAKLHSAKVVFGSATPNVNDYFLAQINNSPILELAKPISKGVSAEVELIDLKNRSNFIKHRFFSNQLLSQIEQALKDRRQILIFHNRRGTAPTTICTNCGWLAECPNCHLPLTLHADYHKLRCHLCGHSQTVPPSCPICHEPTVTFKGIGTKLIESEIKKLFSKARVARFDADTAAKEAAHLRYQEIYDGDIDIIIGTQMLAKGFDLPKLAVVGIIQADSGLLIPDYQSEERVFQLIYQVIGRVGRQDHAGYVVVQTYNPNDPTIVAAIQRDYKSFYAIEIQKRQFGNFPPYRYLLKLTCAYKTEAGAVEASKRMADLIRNKYKKDIEILGPAPAFYEQLGNKFRWQLVLKARERSKLVAIANGLNAPWQFDLDAINLL